VTFVLTVIVGLVAVPLALYLGNQNPSAPVNVPVASSPRTATPAATATPARTATPSPSPTKSP
jgi:hypothetical protein